jgi:hypothetical protein
MNIDIRHTGASPNGMPFAALGIQRSEIVSVVHAPNIYRVGIPVNTCLVDYQKGIVRDNAKMKSISEIRRDNLIDICQSFFDGNQEKLANALGRDKNVISRVLNPQHSQPREIGNSLARGIESTLKIEPNWLDNTHDNKSETRPTDCQIAETLANYTNDRLNHAIAGMTAPQINAMAETILMLRGMNKPMSIPDGIQPELPGRRKTRSTAPEIKKQVDSD